MSEISGLEGGSVEESSKSLDPPLAVTQDAVFGEIIEEGPNYRDVGTFHECLVKWLMIPRLDGWEQWLS